MTATAPVTTAFARFRQGDQSAFDDVVTEYASSAYGTALKILAEPSTAEEAVQEAFVRIWKKAGAFEGSRGSERTWILSIVRNQAIDMLRKRARHATSDIDAVPGALLLTSPDDPWSAVADNLRAATVRDALQQLPAEQRGALELAYFAGLRSTEIARELGIPEGTVRSRMRLALAKLRTLLAGEAETIRG